MLILKALLAMLQHMECRLSAASNRVTIIEAQVRTLAVRESQTATEQRTFLTRRAPLRTLKLCTNTQDNLKAVKALSADICLRCRENMPSAKLPDGENENASRFGERMGLFVLPAI